MRSLQARWIVAFALLAAGCGATSSGDVTSPPDAPHDAVADDESPTPPADAADASPLDAIDAGRDAFEAWPEVTEAGHEAAEPAPEATEPAPEPVEPAPEAAEPAPDVVEPAPDAAPDVPADAPVDTDATTPTGCQADAACDDDDLCTSDRCEVDRRGVGGCVHVAVSTDDADACTTDGCDPAAGVQHVPVDCDDGDPCTVDTCDVLLGCVHVPDCEACPTISPGCGCLDDATCHPSDPCLSGRCVTFEGRANGCVYTAVTCPPEPCQAATCEPDVGCVYVPAVIDDGDACTVDACDPVTGAITFTDRDCDDHDLCTDDSCDPNVGCEHAARTAMCCECCADPVCDPATGVFTFTCDACSQEVTEPLTGGCHLVVTDCDDANPCTIDTCSPVDGCAHLPRHDDDGDACTVDTCDPATGEVAHVPQEVDDHDLCTLDACDPATGAVTHLAVTIDDGNRCTTDSCSPATGTAHDPVVCSVPNACYTATCSPATGCGWPVKKTCSDGLACTLDACDPATGTCSHEANPCSDANACTDDACAEPAGCTHVPVSCDDHDACTVDTCSKQAGCQYAPLVLDDANACTADSCDPVTGERHEPRACDDGDACTVDGCDPATGECTTEPRACDDGDACTRDTCDPAVGCAHPAVCDLTPCDASTCDAPTRTCTVWHHACEGSYVTGETCAFDCDGEACTYDCQAFEDCPDDGDPCTHEVVVGLECTHPPVDCDDGSVCTLNDACDPASGACTSVPLDCDDADPCTVDTCDPLLGCQHAARECPLGCDAATGSCLAEPTCDTAESAVAVMLRLDYVTYAPKGYATPVATGAPMTCDQAQVASALYAWNAHLTWGGMVTCHPLDELRWVSASPTSNGGNALYDGRTGALLFLSTEICGGTGTIQYPGAAGWKAPSALAWLDRDPPEPAAITATSSPVPAAALQAWSTVRRSAPVAQVAACGAYRVDVFLNPVTGCSGSFAPEGAEWIVVVTGTAPLELATCATAGCPPGFLCGPRGCVACDDANPCTKDDLDPATAACRHGAGDCDDGMPCTVDVCDLATGCSHATKSCADTVAGPYGPLPNLCTNDSCNPVTGDCVHAPKNCADGNACTVDGCEPLTGQCTTATLGCDDGDACTTDTCDVSAGCLHPPKPWAFCDCSKNPSCDPATGVMTAWCNDCTREVTEPVTGTCRLETLSCDDGDACTVDTCNGALGCQHEPIGGCTP